MSCRTYHQSDPGFEQYGPIDRIKQPVFHIDSLAGPSVRVHVPCGGGGSKQNSLFSRVYCDEMWIKLLTPSAS